MKKGELRNRLEKLNIPYKESDGVKELRLKLTQVEASSVVSKVNSDLPFIVMDLEDENQILAEIKGEVIDKYFYSFKQGEEEIVGLSKAGVDQSCREYADKGEVIRITSEPLERDEAEHLNVKIKASRFKLYKDSKGIMHEQELDSNWGMVRQWKKMKIKSGALVPDNFYAAKAVAKAQRNAKRGLLPYTFIQAMMKKYIESKNPNDRKRIQVIQADQKITTGHLRHVHAQAAEAKLDHKDLTEFVKKEYGVDSLNDLQINQLTKLYEFIREHKPKPMPDIPFDLLGKFNEKKVMKAKRDMVWGMCLEKSKGDVEEAKALAIKELELIQEEQ